MEKNLKNFTSSSGRKYLTILGVKIDSSSLSSLLRKITVDIKKHKKIMIVTPNPEQVMLAQNDPDFKYILNRADISLPDGVGLIASYRFLSLPRPKDYFIRLATLLVQGLGIGFSIIFDRGWLEGKDLKVVRGRELFIELIKLANKNGWKVYLLGGEGNEAVGTKKVLERNFKNVKLMARQGPMLFNDGIPRTEKDKEEDIKVFNQINEFSPDLLFVAFGAPKQEKWLYRRYKKLNIGGAMVVGVTFKYISGKVKLPPNFIANAGLEWLWRLFSGSQKGKRIWNAFPKFPLKVFLYKLTL